MMISFSLAVDKAKQLKGSVHKGTNIMFGVLRYMAKKHVDLENIVLIILKVL